MMAAKRSPQERAKNYYEDKGMSLIKIGEMLSVSHCTVRNWLLNQGVKMRPRGRRPATN